MVAFLVSCNKCGANNNLDFSYLDEGRMILCRHCDAHIRLTFKGKTPMQISEQFRNDLQRALPPEIKVIIR